MGSVTKAIGLPGRFGNTGDITIAGKLSETNAADTEEAHISVASAAKLASIVHTRREFRLLPSGFCSQEGLEL